MTAEGKAITITFEEYADFQVERRNLLDNKLFNVELRPMPVFDKIKKVLDAKSPYLQITLNMEESTVTLEDWG